MNFALFTCVNRGRKYSIKNIKPRSLLFQERIDKGFSK